MTTRRHVVNKRTSGGLGPDWVTLLSAPRVCHLCARRPGALARPAGLVDVRCPLCRQYHVQGTEHVCMSPLPTKADLDRLQPSSCSIATTGSLLSAFPELLAFLSKSSLAEGTSRKLGKLSLALESGAWKLTLTDVETGLYACLTHASLDDLFLTVEERFERSEMPWRVSSYAPRPRKGRT
jgi:hypothetical protein